MEVYNCRLDPDCGHLSSTNEKLDRANFIEGVSTRFSCIGPKARFSHHATEQAAWHVPIRGWRDQRVKTAEITEAERKCKHCILRKLSVHLYHHSVWLYHQSGRFKRISVCLPCSPPTKDRTLAASSRRFLIPCAFDKHPLAFFPRLRSGPRRLHGCCWTAPVMAH